MAPAHPGPGVLVTRPAAQADSLCRAIEAAGGRAIRFPTLEIRDPAEPAISTAAGWLREAAGFDLLVFVSANAVERAAPFLPPGLRTPVAAVGDATARALRSHGFAPIVPADRADSEGLLDLPALQRVAGWRVLIVRGEGGRALLAETLTARGAAVAHAVVYRRAIPAVDPAPLLADWQGQVQAIVATSNDGLDNLLALLGPDGTRKALPTPLLVVSERMAGHARRHGFTRVLVAGGASDDAVVRTLRDAGALTPPKPDLLG
jgi:uroporphyrinogen-III synthase